jgi:hypothetical protein
VDESRRTSGGGNRRSRVDESRRTSGGTTSHRGSTGIAGLWRKASLKARALARLEGAAPSERASAGAEGSEAPAAAPSPPRSGTRSGTRMRWRRNGGGDPEVARVDAGRFTEADLD